MMTQSLRGAAAFGLCLALSLPAMAGAPPPRHHRHVTHRRALAAISPIQPLTAPAHPASDKTAAPVPNPAITPPIDNSDQSTTLKPAVMQIHYPPQGDGYVAGSSVQAMDDRQAAKVTGVQLKMPLGQ